MEIFTKIKKLALDILFPIHCLSCGKYGQWLCPACFSQIKSLPYQVCPVCEKRITEKGALCEGCKKSGNARIDAMIAAARYKENGIDELSHKFKYNFITDLQLILGEIMVRSILNSGLPLPDFIIPVPLHPRRLRWRGFNQAELLADYIAKNLAPGIKIPVRTDLVARRKYTSPQMKIGKYSDRRKNIRDAFVFSNKEIEPTTIKGKKILLVDDIATTGATLFECARILKENGAKKVFGAVLARQEFEK